MPSAISEALVVGATGLCGSHFLKQLLPKVKVTTITRRDPAAAVGLGAEDTANLNAIIESDHTKWPSLLPTPSPDSTSVVFSGLGTTKKAAGGIANQRLIDLDLNYDIAAAAKEKGYKGYVLVSSTMADASSRFPYLQMKGELEDKVKALGFDYLVILQPGALVGQRNQPKDWVNTMMMKAGGMVRTWGISKYLMAPILGEDVAKIGIQVVEEMIAAEDKSVRVLDGKTMFDMARKLH